MGKRKKIELVAFVAILVFSAFVTLPIATASPDVIYVPEDYAKIQWAIDNASAGDTIIVKSGTYYENVLLNKGVTLQGEDLPTIDAQGKEHAIKITADNSIIRGLMCINATRARPHWDAGIKVLSCGNIIENNSIVNNSDGVMLESENNEIKNNKINNSICNGIRLCYFGPDALGHKITNNKIRDCGWDGIYGGCSNSVISDNIFEGHSGIYLQGGKNNRIIDNIFRNCGFAIGSAYTTYNNEVENNTVNGKPLVYRENVEGEEITDAGQVILVNCKGVIVKNCNLSCRTKMGVEIQNSFNCSIFNNTCNNNGHGIYLRSSSNNTIKENKFCYNSWNGVVMLEFSDNNTIENNEICENKQEGIYAYHVSAFSNNNTIKNNKICKNNKGIYANSMSTEIIKNEICYNNFDGIRWVGGSSNMISSNEIYGNEGTGICSYSSNSEITNNQICNNGRGISSGSNDNLITDNICNNNTYEGVYLSSLNNTLTNNTCKNNTYGIHIDSSSNNTITTNTCKNNTYGIHIDSSSNNTITNNNVNTNGNGIYLYGYYNNNNNNLIYDNYFNNTNNAYDEGNNIWSISKTKGTNILGRRYIGGNYWSDYAGEDLDEDGLGDTLLPYNSSRNIQNGGDWVPLIKVEEKTYTKRDVGVTSNITSASPTDLAQYLPPEYTDTDVNDAIVLNVNVTDITPDTTDDAYTNITINVGSMDIETCKVFKTDIGFLPEVDDITALPTVSGDPAFSRDLVNKTVTVRLYVGDPLLGVIPAAVEAVFDTGEGTYPSIMGTHNGTIIPSRDINVSKIHTYPCAGTGGHTESIELYENGTLIASGVWEGYEGDWHNITIDNETGASYVMLLKGHKYNYTIVTGSYPQIIHESSKEVTGGTISCTEFVDANGKIYYDWIPAIRLE